jgi:hypothetical protein
MALFLMLCRGGSVSDQERGAHMQKWGAWMGGLAQSGSLTGGAPLQGGGKVVSSGGVKDAASGDDVVSGYIMVNAKSLDDAVKIAKGCPLLEIGGNLEIRESVDMSGGPPRN